MPINFSLLPGRDSVTWQRRLIVTCRNTGNALTAKPAVAGSLLPPMCYAPSNIIIQAIAPGYWCSRLTSPPIRPKSLAYQGKGQWWTRDKPQVPRSPRARIVFAVAIDATCGCVTRGCCCPIVALAPLPSYGSYSGLAF
jgi:hypothetical protein